jgi:hypothetical protein
VQALDVIEARFGPVDLSLWTAAAECLDWLWRSRLRGELLAIVHPWESGADISPRWDAWYNQIDSQAPRPAKYDVFTRACRFDGIGPAAASQWFEVCPSAFNAIAAHAAGRLAVRLGDPGWYQRAAQLKEAIDSELWDEASSTWVDRVVVGPDSSCRVPTLDGVIGALGSINVEHSRRALELCLDPEYFHAPYGLRYVPRAAYEDAYWRGPTWPQLNYLVATAAKLHDRPEIAAEVARMTIDGALTSGFAEYWDPLTGRPGTGAAVPQTWATIATALEA